MAVDRNSQMEAISVILNMVGWTGLRHSTDILISFFQNRKMKVKWNGKFSKEHILNGGGPQGGLMGILEYLSQTNNNTDFISEELKFKFIDDLSFIEILNLISQGLCSFNLKSHVASDINSQHNQYLPT